MFNVKWPNRKYELRTSKQEKKLLSRYVRKRFVYEMDGFI